jgi:LmbE family N-acetylglucosaminyl deacetylase
MTEIKKMLCIFAHPDDETLGMGPAIARYAAEGVEVNLITATGGERGWFGTPGTHPGFQVLAAMRKTELHAAAKILGIARVDRLGGLDGELDQAEPQPLLAKLVQLIREIRPQVVVSFGPDGGYGHPDHIAISQLTAAALLRAADPIDLPEAGPSHRVLKFYYMVTGEKAARAYHDQGMHIEMNVGGVARTLVAWPEWAITTRVQAAAYLSQVYQAILCHQTQLPSLPGIESISLNAMAEFLGEQTFYRAYSLVSRSCEREDDLFQGIE